MLWLRRAMVLLLAMLFTVVAPAQQTQAQPQTPPPPPAVQQEQKQAAQPDRKITDAEAQELFKSFDEILQFASKDTGLPIKSPVKHKIVGRDEVEQYMLERMKEDPDAKKLEASEVSLKKLGLIPKDMNLRSFLVSLLKEQIAGFYDSKTKVMYILDWVSPEAQKPVLAHELTHALQDQNYDLEKWGQVNEDKLGSYDEMVRDEQRAARQAVVEGQATVVLVDYLLSGMGQSVASLSPEQFQALKSQMVNGGSTPLFSKSPIFLKLALMFPYDAGLDFERALLSAGGKLQSYAGVFRNPPVDTRQILEPKTYLDQKHFELPKLADVPGLLGKDYDKFDDGGFGEFDLEILVKQWMPTGAPTAADGPVNAGDDPNIPLLHSWRGGYYMSFRKKNDKSQRVYMAFLMKLASPSDAKAFETVYREGLKQRYTSLVTKPNGVIDSEEGPVIFSTDGSSFTATEGFDEATAAKIRAAILKTAAQDTKMAAVGAN